MPRKKKEDQKITNAPTQFEKDDEHGLTEMQASFVWHYTEGACGQTDAARKAGYEFPAVTANKLLSGKHYPNVVTAIRIRQDELAAKYAITPQKTGTMLWKVKERTITGTAGSAAVGRARVVLGDRLPAGSLPGWSCAALRRGLVRVASGAKLTIVCNG